MFKSFKNLSSSCSPLVQMKKIPSTYLNQISGFLFAFPEIQMFNLFHVDAGIRGCKFSSCSCTWFLLIRVNIKVKLLLFSVNSAIFTRSSVGIFFIYLFSRASLRAFKPCLVGYKPTISAVIRMAFSGTLLIVFIFSKSCWVFY